ncbi:helix-turn-helix transcriptional regulator [Burkholderia multivorans]|uniref:helix-turn-helix transcriptional regulator n=1 Tax=Burkholderia multivorans TaxID=87883 RepID=UPI00350F50BF
MEKAEVSRAADEFVASRESKKKQIIKQFDDLPNAAVVDDSVVAALCGCNVATVWDRAKKGTLPKPVKIGGSTRWHVGKLRSYLSTGVVQEAEADDATLRPLKSTASRQTGTSMPGTTLRDQFAMHALAGLLASGWCEEGRVLHDSGWTTVAEDSWKAADAMLRAREGS